MAFKDYFSQHAQDYRRYRPRYPESLFQYLASLPPARELAWDCGTGNGQAAVMLAKQFQRVVATDPSSDQIANAEPQAGVEYVVAPAEATELATASVDLVTVAQAAHWFDLPRFYAEVRRVSRPGGIVACWCYALAKVNPAVDAVVLRLYEEILGAYWPPERRIVEQAYAGLPFPFARIEAPQFAMQENWNLEQLAGYLHTWSSAQRYQKQHGVNPITLVADELSQAWGDPGEVHAIQWAITVLAGRVGGHN